MPYVLPTFNLSVNIWWWEQYLGLVPPGNPPDVITVCNLALGRRIGSNDQPHLSSMWLLLPALTDIRCVDLTGTATQPGLVEVPAGSGRYYDVDYVDDIGKGFANEHRFALIHMVLPVVVPMP